MVRTLRRGDRLIIASHNAGKLREMEDFLRPHGVSVARASALGVAEPDETGLTFEDNARIKALASAAATGLPALADDSGLAVEALGGAPGIYSARWAGPDRDFGQAMRTVEEKLAAVGAETSAARAATFVSVLCLAFPDGSNEVFRGEVKGSLVWPPRGDGGFGYDPMFLPDGEVETFGEMDGDWKHRISHRARAFARFADACLSTGADR